MAIEEAISIREYRRGDEKAMQALDEVCFDTRFRFGYRTMRQLAQADEAMTWLAEVDGGLIGFVLAHAEPLGSYLMTLDVAPAWRRRHVAALLMDRLEEAVARTPVPEIRLHVFAQNEAAIRFYEGRGYECMERAVEFYGAGLDGWMYRKAVEPQSNVAKMAGRSR
jgi:ribosomal protein S18 acetylase RimI-like enzyme